MPILIVIALVFAAVGLWWLLRVLKDRKRARLRQSPFPEEWKGFLEKHVPLYRRLPDSMKDELHGDILVFLDEKRFEGCGGFEVTQEVKVVVACEASLLLLNKKPSFFPRLTTILIYPSAYVAKQKEALGPAMVDEDSVRAGEAWDKGTLILAWDRVEGELSSARSAHNVILHEFAHELDFEDGKGDGTPPLPSRSMISEWARVLGAEYDKLHEDLEKHRRTVIDPYGATNPAEFFAVATEAFFQKPEKLKQKEPALYDELKKFYRLDPVSWG